MEETCVGHGWVSHYDLAPKRERSVFRSQVDILNEVSGGYDDLYYHLSYKRIVTPCEMEEFIILRSLLEEHVDSLSSMLETRSKKTVLGHDLYKECWHSINRGEDYLSERYPILWTLPYPLMVPPLSFRNVVQPDDSSEDEDNAADILIGTSRPGPVIGSMGFGSSAGQPAGPFLLSGGSAFKIKKYIVD